MDSINRIDLPDGRKLKTERADRSSGQIFRATVLTKTGRVLGTAEINIPLSPGYTLAERIGANDSEAIEQSVIDLAKRIADAVQTEPNPGHHV